MIRISEPGFIPAFDYAEYSLAELQRGIDFVPQIEKQSERLWVVQRGDSPLFVAGIVPQSLITVARLWFLLCNPFLEESKYWNLRAIRKLMRELDKQGYHRVETLVEAEWDIGQRFARFCGFRPTGLRQSVFDKDYLVLERR